MPQYDSYGALDDRIIKESDRGFTGFNNRLRPDQLQPGVLADAQNLRLDRNGEAQVRKGVELIVSPLSTGVSALSLPFYLVVDDTSVTATQTAGAVVLTNVDATNFPSTGTVNVSGVSGLTPAVNGDRAFTRNSSTQITIADQTYTGTASGTATVKFGILNDSAVNAIYGSCAFSDPNSAASQYIIFATNAKAVAVNVSTGATSDIAYPVGLSVSAEVSMLQAFNKVFIFRNGETALEWNGDFSGTPAFTKVASGTYTQPVPISLTDIDYASGIATATAASGSVSTLLVGDTLTFTSAGSSTYAVGDTVVVQSIPSSTTFTFVTDKADDTNKNGTVQKQVSVGLGFSHMPSPPYAEYHQRRLVMPFNFSVDASADSFTSRGILDEIIASDILDTDTYDQIYAQYRFNAGEADFNVGLHSFSEDNLMVFNRNSIHLVQNTTDLATASTKLLTNEVGCVARKSIEQIGNQVIFLSDNGVYSTQFFDEYNLRGTETPLSEPINSTIQRINKEHWDKSVGVYFNNRYFLAVPLDDSDCNNAILVYNFLNKQWESVDQVGDANFHSTNLILVGDGDDRAVYVVNDIGGVHRLDKRVDGIDRVMTQIGGTQQNIKPPFSLTTRQYTLGTMDRKRWKEFDFHIQSSEDNVSDVEFSAETENPDATVDLQSLSVLNGGDLAIDEDVSVRGRIGNKRGYGIQFTMNNTTGRPRIRSVEVEGSITMRSTNKAI